MRERLVQRAPDSGLGSTSQDLKAWLSLAHTQTHSFTYTTHHAYTHTDTLTHRGPGFFDVQGPATPRGTHISVCPGVNRLSNCPVVPTVCTKLKDFRILKFKVTSLSWKPPACGQGPGSYHELLLSEDLPDGRAEAPRETEPRNHKLLKPPKGNFQLGRSQNYGTLSVNEQRKRMREREVGGSQRPLLKCSLHFSS